MNNKTKTLLLAAMLLSCVCLHGRQIVYNVVKGPLTIPGNSTDEYVITGNVRSYDCWVEIEPGFHGKIILRNLYLYMMRNEWRAPFTVRGVDGASNLAPVSVVDIVLEGKNELVYNGRRNGAGLQVDQGTQINISAIDSLDNASGTLKVSNVEPYIGGAAIGARLCLNGCLENHYEAHTMLPTSCDTVPRVAAGGNIVISSGTIEANGAHGAGIGGGHMTYYDGMIVIYGGDVKATVLHHAAGIGSGCPNRNGVEPNCYTPNSGIVVLPPATIGGYGAGDYDVEHGKPRPELALGGAGATVYIGDPAKPKVDVRTVDNEPFANIYVDLTQNPTVRRVVEATCPPERLDANKVKFGAADALGVYSFNGILPDPTTFFTDARCSRPGEDFGRPYVPSTRVLTTGGEVVLELLRAKLAVEFFPSKPLAEGYESAEADDNACCIKLVYTDPIPMTDLVFDLAKGDITDFSALTFLAADSVTRIAAPTALNPGDIYYVKIPLRQGKPVGEYSDVLRFVGNWNGLSTGYIRQVISQLVLKMERAEICQGETYAFAGKTFDKSGIYEEKITGADGESTATLSLKVNPVYNQTETQAICRSELPYTWRGENFGTDAVSGKYEFKKKTKAGCDSVVVLNLQVDDCAVPPDCADKRTDISETVCRGETYRFNGRDLSVSGEYEFTTKSAAGCDSLVVLKLFVKECEENIGGDDDDVEDGNDGKPDNGNEIGERPSVPQPCSGELEFPLYFTPNGDGRHDRWEIADIGCRNHSVEIYDRFGKRLGSWKNNFSGWDGTYRGELMPSTDYWYYVRLSDGRHYVGHFTLVRN